MGMRIYTGTFRLAGTEERLMKILKKVFGSALSRPPEEK
jgi:hypothetical protein